MKFTGNWKDEEKIPLQEKIKDKLRSPGSLKPRIDSANKRMHLQIRKLDVAAKRISKRDRSLFAKTVKAYSTHDVVRAKVYANELVEIRKTQKQILNTKLALEQISMRLDTVSEFGDVVGLLSPTVGVLQNIGKGISGAMPEAGKELGQIGNLLNGIICETNQNSGMDIDFEAQNNEESKSILDEAAKVAEESIKQQLPEIPVDISPVKEKVLTKT